ncbi:MAG: seg [Candidatus Paceibacter sp.]|jgi:hypothetical protein|nr:seg [Candidatus Paceibacter sp.]
MRLYTQKGIALVEVLIGSAIITTGIVALIACYNIYLTYAFANSGNVQAAYLMEEGLEAMTLLRDKGWTNNFSKLSTTTVYYLRFATSTWATTTTAQYVDNTFLRSIELDDVFRDTNGAVVSSGGTFDANSRKVLVRLQYFQGKGTTTKTMTTFLTNLNSD